MNHRVFSIIGVHGSGKTTIYNSLRVLHSRDPGWVFLPERKGRPPYPFGSKDPQIAFRAELWYFRQMLQRNEQIRERGNHSSIILCDRSPICILAYSYALCSPDDYKIIRDLYFGVDWLEDTTFYLEMNLNSTIARLTSGRRKNLLKWREGDELYISKVIEGYERAFREVRHNKHPELVRIPNIDAGPKETIQRIDKEILDTKR
jgi:thymidylate kinase